MISCSLSSKYQHFKATLP